MLDGETMCSVNDTDGRHRAKQSILGSDARDRQDGVRVDVQHERPIRRHRNTERTSSFALCCENDATVTWMTGVFDCIHGDEDANGQAKSLSECEV